MKPRRAIVSLLLLAGSALASGGTVYPSPDAVQPLAVGGTIPSAVVHGVGGESVDLREQMRDAGALLVFYRGGW